MKKRKRNDQSRKRVLNKWMRMPLSCFLAAIIVWSVIQPALALEDVTEVQEAPAAAETIHTSADVVTETPAKEEAGPESGAEEGTGEPEPVQPGNHVESEPSAEPAASAEPSPSQEPEPSPSQEPVPSPQIEEIPQPDLTADVENALVWSGMFRNAVFGIINGENLLTVARSQIGYQESTKNFKVVQDQICGYSRYGAWYGEPYGDWNAMFVSFCLSYSGISEQEIPYEKDSARWAARLSGLNMFAVPGSYTPKPGDLLFLRENGVIRVAVLESAGSALTAIEGDCGGAVCRNVYSVSDSRIYGFGILPEQMPAQQFTAMAGSEVWVGVSAEAGSLPAGTVMTAALIRDQQVLDAVEAAVEEEVEEIQAVDITFRDYYGREIEPKHPVSVAMASEIVPDADPVVVHLDDAGQTQVVETQTAENCVVFDADAFSVYAIVTRSLEQIVKTTSGAQYRITASYDSRSGIPSDAELVVAELLPGTAEYDEYVAQSLETVGRTAGNLDFAHAFDISIRDSHTGEHIQPTKDVSITVELLNEELNQDAEISVVHFGDQPERVDASVSGEAIEFSTSGFSVFVVQQVKLEKVISTTDGQTYQITVEYDTGSGFPADAEIRAVEATAADAAFAENLEGAAEAMGVDVSALTYTKLIDISIVDGTGKEYQPDHNVKVTITLLDEASGDVQDLRVVHHGQIAEELPATTSGASVSFETDGFSYFSLNDTSVVSRTAAAVLDTREGTLFENDDIILTGRMPKYGIVEASPADVMIDGKAALIAYDITIYANSAMKALGLPWQPTEGALQVRVKSDALVSATEGVKVYHMADPESEAELVSENLKAEGGEVTFAADSFSVYAITAETYHRTYRFFTLNAQMQYVEYTLYTDLGTTTYTQTIKNGEKLVVPQLPAIPGSTTTTFAGWYVGTGSVSAQPIDPASITLESEEFDFDNIPEITTNGEEVHLFARFADFAYVIFHDQYNGASGSFPVAMTRRGEKTDGKATVDIHDFSVAYDDDSGENSAPSMAFHGWSYTPITTPGSSVDDNGNPVSRIETDAIEITGNVDLYPVFMPIHWLNYYSGPAGSGATYIPSHYYYVGEGPDSLTAPVRSGYTFDGWYTGSLSTTENEDGTTTETVNYGTRVSDGSGTLVTMSDSENGVFVRDGRLLLSKNATIYAKWIESTVNYTVVIWRQKATDNANLADGDKSYDYAESIVLSGTTGQTVSVANAYKQYGGRGEYAGFTYGRCDEASIVKGDGSTVLNVYYDRNVHVMAFFTGETIRFNNGSNWTATLSNSAITNSRTISSLENNKRTISGVVISRTSNNGTYAVKIGESWYQVSGRNASGIWNATSITNPIVTTITALYGANINAQFPGIGDTVYAGYQWEDVSAKKIYGFFLTSVDTMPDADVTFFGKFRGTAKTIYYYVEVNQSESQRTFNGKYYKLFKTVKHDYNYITFDEEYHPITGYTRDYSHASPAFNSTTKQAEIGSRNINYLYYDRETFGISFLDSYTSTFAFVGGNQPENKLGETDVLYSETVKDYVPADPTPVQIAGSIVNIRDGYRFTGWYTDPACSTRVFFEDSDEYRNYTRSKVLLTTMPAYNLRFYAGWETIWYQININPNYGWLNDGNGTGSTWFWEPYNGDPIEEYTWVKRDYVESGNGTYFYHYDTRTGHGWGDDWTSEEDADAQRFAYYTTSQGDATDHARTFRYAENAYRYAGWYEIDPETGEETLYNFGEPVTHDTYLILHWKKIGTYLVSYNAVVTQNGETLAGTIDGGDSNEMLFAELDADHYADNAEVVISRTAHAPEGYNFVGWTIRGDSSGTIYYPGQSFAFLSKYAVVMPEGETIFLDAVYTRVSTAKIIYNANGGRIDRSALDYGAPVDASAPTPAESCDLSAGTATIENLVNNSEIRLSSGGGFVMENATLAGWSTSPAFDPESDTLYALNGNYYVDTEDPVTLYAVWAIRVYFDKNNANASWGGTWSGYTWDSERQQYYITTYVNRIIDEPADVPVSGDPDERFAYWSPVRYTDSSDVATEFDFSAPVTEETTLYGFWANAIQVAYHVVDASRPELENRDDSWRTEPGYFLVNTGTDIDLSAHQNEYASVPGGYVYAFACVSDSRENCSDAGDRAITAVSYNTAGKCVQVTYQNGTTADLPSGQQIYLVYYQEKDLSIGYKSASLTGELTNQSVTASAPRTASNLGLYNMTESVTRPKTYAGFDDYGDNHYYSYAIGEKNAVNESQLLLITESSDSQSSGSRPNLQVRNSWRGFQYSVDGGSTWISCGYDIELYVIYYTQQPRIITIGERTVGTANDVNTETFHYKVEITNSVSSDGTIAPLEFDLKSGETRSVTAFYWTTSSLWPWGQTTHTQTVKVTQSAKSGYVTFNDSTGVNHVSDTVYTYTTSSSNDAQSVTYTNVHTPLTVDVHVALVDGNRITLDDNERSDTHTITVPIDIPADEANTKYFLREIPEASLFTGDRTNYGFAGVVYGRGENTQGANVIVAGADVSSVTYAQMYPEDAGRSNICELVLNDSTGAAISQLGSYQVYYLYYPLPKVQYVKETSGGALAQIVPDGAGLRNSGSPITLNGTNVTQNQMLAVGTEVFTVTQDTAGTASNHFFNMPLVLDDTTASPAVASYLRYTKLGAGASGAQSTSDLDAVTDTRTLMLRVEGNQVKWSLDGTAWSSFSGAPTVYAIYSEIGYDLRITKNVADEPSGANHSFALTLTSAAITKTSYTITGTGYPTVSATPATASTPGTIKLTVRGGSDITISGLGRGDYTITEGENSSYTLTAAVDGEGVSVASNQTIDPLTLDADKTVALTNTRKYTEVTILKSLTDPRVQSGTFRFAGTLTDGTADITASVTGLSGFDITADTASGTANTYTGTVTYTLPVGATLTVRETGADEYNVEADVSSAEDLDGSDEAVKFTVPENGAAVTFRNTPKGEQVRILVVDGDTGEPLSGTSFTLTGFGTLDGDADGLLFEGALIRNETYSLAETEAPSGYDKAQPVDILVSAGDVSLSHNNGVSVELGEDGVWVITVNNYKTPIAPTGFAQNFLPYLWILLLGLMMLLLALVLRRDQKEDEQ